MILRRESRDAISKGPASGSERMADRGAAKEERKAGARKSAKADTKKKSKKTKAPKPAAEAAPAPRPPEPKAIKDGDGSRVAHERLSYAEMMALLSPDQHRTLEALSQNL